MTDHRATVLATFLRWEQEQPDKVFLTQPTPDGPVVDYTWAQAGDLARRMAAYLRSLPLPPGSCIALLGRNSAHWIICDIAIMMAGHVSVPIFATMAAEQARYILDHSESKLLLLGKLDGTADNWPNIEKALPAGLPMLALPMSPRRDIPQWDDVIARHEPLPTIHDAQPHELCSIMYTSGSTGKPKGVMHSYGGMHAICPAMAEVIGGGSPEERAVSYLPLAHVAERAFVHCVLYLGGRIYFCNNLSTFAEDLRRARPTLFFSVPRLWTKFRLAVNAKLPAHRQRLLFALPLVSHLVKHKILRELGLDHARICFTGSAPLSPEIVAWYRNLGLEMLEGYGMTEAYITHCSRPGHARPGYVGKCTPGVQARIDDNGEILIKGPSQMMGYYKDPELTSRVTLPDGFFLTGDRGELDAEGRLRITGRTKELFKTERGEYVAPAPIEDLLGAHPRLEGVCVTGANHPRPFALLMLSAEAQKAISDKTLVRAELEAELGTLLHQVNAQLANHEKLSCVVVTGQPWTVENGLLTPTLKIKRDAIENRYLPGADAWLATERAVVWE